MVLRTLTASLLACPLLASAATYSTIDADSSKVEFYYEQMGVTMSGTFTDINGQIHFDTAEPEKATATVEIAMNSADTGLEEADSEIVKKEWFNAKDFPQAVFSTTAITSTSGDEYEVTGLLTIKGHEHEITFPATVTENDNQAVFAGSFSILRGDYAVGEGAWSKFDIVANDIRVDFNLVATE